MTISIAADLWPLVVCTGVKHGTANDWEMIMGRYSTTTFPAEMAVYLDALASTEDTELLIRSVPTIAIFSYNLPIFIHKMSRH